LTGGRNNLGSTPSSKREIVIGGHHRPMAVDRQRRVRFVRGQNEIDSLAGSAERRVVQRPLRKHRRVSRGNQQPVAFTQRNLEPLGKTQNHLPARQRSAGLDKA
jgi:hypothetical protein